MSEAHGGEWAGLELETYEVFSRLPLNGFMFRREFRSDGLPGGESVVRAILDRVGAFD